jgi:hypothetical protein
MLKNKWLWAAVVIVIVLGWLWYSGMLNGLMMGGDDASAAAANAVKGTAVATSIQKTVADINTAAGNKDAKAVEALKPELAATISMIAEYAAQLDRIINNAANKGKDVGAAKALYTDLTTKISYLQSSMLTLQNAQIDMQNLNDISADIASIKTALQKK